MNINEFTKIENFIIWDILIIFIINIWLYLIIFGFHD